MILLLTSQPRLTMHSRGGTDRMGMNSHSRAESISEGPIPMRMNPSSTNQGRDCLVSSQKNSLSTSTTSATTGPIYARWASTQSIHWRPSASFPIGRCHISAGVIYPTNTAGVGATMTETLKRHLTLGSETFRRYNLAGVRGERRSLVSRGDLEGRTLIPPCWIQNDGIAPRIPHFWIQWCGI